MRLATLALLLAACGDDGMIVPVDAASTVDAPYDTSRCLITGFYGAIGAKQGSTSLGVTTSTIVLDPGPPRDSFLLKLNAGKGVFTGGLAAGTYPLTGTEINYNGCGACLNIVADIGNMGPQKFYFATGGSLTLTATSPPAGSISNVTFQEVTSTGAMVPAGCVARIDSMMFTTQ